MREITKELFCKTLDCIREQDAINDVFDNALETVCDGYPGYGIKNKYRDALYDLLEWVFEDDPDFCLIWDWVNKASEVEEKRAEGENIKEVVETIWESDGKTVLFEIRSDEDLYDWLTGPIRNE